MDKIDKIGFRIVLPIGIITFFLAIISFSLILIDLLFELSWDVFKILIPIAFICLGLLIILFICLIILFKGLLNQRRVRTNGG